MNKNSNANETSRRQALPFPPMLFDLDGTLVDSAYQHVLAWHETFVDFRMDIPNWKIHRRIGMSGSFFLPPLMREIGHSTNLAAVKQLEKRHAKYFTRRINTVCILSGARELLQHLSKIGLPWTIATSGERAQTEKLVKGLQLPKSLPVVTGDDVKNAKPAPDIFLFAAEKLGVAISDCIIVGDSPWDLLAGRRMKALGVGLLCGGYAKEELERAGAHLVYDDPAELLENLAELGIKEDKHVYGELEQSIWREIMSAKQSAAARKNIKKAANAARKKRTIAHLPKSVRTALGKKGAAAAKRKRSKG